MRDVAGDSAEVTAFSACVVWETGVASPAGAGGAGGVGLGVTGSVAAGGVGGLDFFRGLAFGGGAVSAG